MSTLQRTIEQVLQATEPDALPELLKLLTDAIPSEDAQDLADTLTKRFALPVLPAVAAEALSDDPLIALRQLRIGNIEFYIQQDGDHSPEIDCTFIPLDADPPVSAYSTINKYMRMLMNRIRDQYDRQVDERLQKRDFVQANIEGSLDVGTGCWAFKGTMGVTSFEDLNGSGTLT